MGHPKGFVAAGTHNLHSRPGGDPGPVKEAVQEAVEEFKKKAEEKLDDLETTKDVVVLLAKIAAGWGIGGLWGAIAGAIEAAVTDPPDIDIGGNLPGGPGSTPGRGEKVPDTTFGVILAPESVRTTVPEAGVATEVQRWRQGVRQRQVNRDTQPWWRESTCLPRSSNTGRPAYAGRWGVMCTEDALDQRSGIPFPDFLCALNQSLLIKLSKDNDA